MAFISKECVNCYCCLFRLQSCLFNLLHSEQCFMNHRCWNLVEQVFHVCCGHGAITVNHAFNSCLLFFFCISCEMHTSPLFSLMIRFTLAWKKKHHFSFYHFGRTIVIFQYSVVSCVNMMNIENRPWTLEQFQDKTIEMLCDLKWKHYFCLFLSFFSFLFFLKKKHLP